MFYIDLTFMLFRCPERVGAEVVECACVIGLPEVKVIKNILLSVNSSHCAVDHL